jgi:hypothetical protein
MGQKIKVIDPLSEVFFEVTKQFEVETENGDQYLFRMTESSKYANDEFLYKPKGEDDYLGHWGQDNDYPEEVRELAARLLEGYYMGMYDIEGEFDIDDLDA